VKKDISGGEEDLFIEPDSGRKLLKGRGNKYGKKKYRCLFGKSLTFQVSCTINKVVFARNELIKVKCYIE
jgi:hypothetical protein